MDQLIPSLEALLAPFAVAFRQEVFRVFCSTVGAWIVCLGRRTISRVWETTGQSETRNHASAFRLFSAAAWNWDEVCAILALAVVAQLVPGMWIWVVVDDTLCHKRGAKVAFGGIFLDAVLSSRRHKVFRFGNNWVLLGIVVQLPFRKDRYFCLPSLWRIYQKRGKKSRRAHRSKSQLAAELITLFARWFPGRKNPGGGRLRLCGAAPVAGPRSQRRGDRSDPLGRGAQRTAGPWNRRAAEEGRSPPYARADAGQ